MASRIKVEQNGEVSIVHFLDKRILDEPTIQVIAEQLFAIVDDQKVRKMVLNFSNVEYMSSAALGKLINLHKKLVGVQGRMAMCNVIPQILEVFTITRLDKIFKIHPDEDTAIKALT